MREGRTAYPRSPREGLRLHSHPLQSLSRLPSHLAALPRPGGGKFVSPLWNTRLSLRHPLAISLARRPHRHLGGLGRHAIPRCRLVRGTGERPPPSHPNNVLALNSEVGSIWIKAQAAM